MSERYSIPQNSKKFELHLFICLANAAAYTYEVSKTRKFIRGHREWYQSKAHMRLPTSD